VSFFLYGSIAELIGVDIKTNMNSFDLDVGEFEMGVSVAPEMQSCCLWVLVLHDKVKFGLQK